MFDASDHRFMAEALRLAEKGMWTTDPNPRVGCVLVKNERIIGAGWHRRAGEAHAEVLALEDAGAKAHGATVYVTLEPCSHAGRTPPCTQALIEAGVAEVIAAMPDPDPQVAGSGLKFLERAGIRVRAGLMQAQARALNPGFVSRHERGRPWVRLKLAGSLDGRSVGPDGQSRWITGEASRADGHRWRARAGAILTGIGTVLSDDPRLTVRARGAERQPLIVVADSRGRIPPGARLLSSTSPVLVASGRPRPDGLECDWLELPVDGDGRIRLMALLEALAGRQVNELHVEAGATLSGALLAAELADELLIYMAPSLIGADGGPLVRLPGLEKFDERLHLNVVEIRRVGADIRIRLRSLERS